MPAKELTTEGKMRVVKTALKYARAKDSLLDFAQLMRPDPDDVENPDASMFEVCPHHRLIAEALERVERGECLRLAISMPPQHGKSEQISRMFPAWLIGRKPFRKVMFGTYSQDFANTFGAEVREIMQSAQYQDIFPGVNLRSDSKAKDFLGVQGHGGQLAFIGRGGAGTGKPADLFVIDDPIKDDEEAQSPTLRDKVWQWFTKVAYTRCHKLSAIVIVHTRWHEDDLIGRMLDPDHPEHDPTIAKDWTYLNIPAVITEPKLAEALGIEMAPPPSKRCIAEFGDKPMVALWGTRFSLDHLATAHRLNPRGFNALYMGTPSAEEGDYFKREWIKHYHPDHLPDDLRIYAASDHALSEKQGADYTVLGCVGVDAEDNIYVLPELIWNRMQTDATVERMIWMMKHKKPVLWFAESDNIKKSIGPFLRKRMREERVYVPVFDMSTAKGDKVFRARSIQGRMAMGKVFFPPFAHWFQKAQNELLKFPNAAHDDFVDWLAWIGLGLDSEQGATGVAPASNIPKRGTFGWLKWSSKRKAGRLDKNAQEGW
jgi:predicted phage terminase large subunit-like protein